MPRIVALVVALGAAAAVAHAEPAAPTRIVLADGDPALQRALVAALAGWEIDLVVEPTAPATTAAAEAQAAARDAQFVVWRRGGDIVVFDRRRGAAELRDAPAGPLDPASATAAALSVKTLLRLPPPGVARVVPVPVPVAPLRETPGRVRIQVGAGARLASGLGVRAGGAVLVRPFARHAWRIGVAGEAGTSDSIEDGSFRGTASDAAVLALASLSFALRAPLWLEPFAGAGVARVALDGVESSRPRTEADTVGLARAGVWLRWQRAAWSVGVGASLDVVLGAPTYTRLAGNGVVYEVPAVAGSLGLVAAFDIGP